VTNVNIELPSDLHTKIKLKAVRENKTIEQVVTEVLEKRVKQ
jgi:predicted HicB family RNase H-like nuclease